MGKNSKLQIVFGGICGILMLLSVLVYIIMGVFFSLWHPYWVIIPCTGLVCGIISICVNTYTSLSNSNKNDSNQLKK